jgi:hypothetical protein
MRTSAIIKRAVLVQAATLGTHWAGGPFVRGDLPELTPIANIPRRFGASVSGYL